MNAHKMSQVGLISFSLDGEPALFLGRPFHWHRAILLFMSGIHVYAQRVESSYAA